MTESLKLLCILAHPDDESLVTGGILAHYAAEGVETYVISATRGQKGWFSDPAAYPGPVALGRIREAELRAAADVLGLQEAILLDYQDGELDRADAGGVIRQLVAHIRRIRPQVVVTFDPTGLYGHPDHIAIGQFANGALVSAANPFYDYTAGAAHQVAKLYYRVFTQPEQVAYEAAFGRLVMNIDGVDRGVVAWPTWAVSSRIDTAACWEQVWQAVACHRSQLPGYQKLRALPDEYHHMLWGSQTFYRAFSLVNAGRAVEDDLFAGVRQPAQLHRLQLPVAVG